VSLLKNDTAITRLLPVCELFVLLSLRVPQLLLLTLSWKGWHVDVRDCTGLHVIGLTTPTLGGETHLDRSRHLGVEPDTRHLASVQVPEYFEDGEPDRQRIDGKVAREVLGGWIGLWIRLEQSLIESVTSLGY
jgi:hypothetical protein